MKGNRAALVAIAAIALLVAGWWLFTRGGAATAIDLIEQFDAAEKRPAGGSFTVEEVDLNGETRRAINAQPPTRITWKVRVPDDAWLKVAVGLKPEAWTQEGNGVLFLVGVSDGRTFDELFTQHVSPFTNAGDRRWIPVWVDLSAYAGEEVDLIFNTRTSPAGQGDDPRHDLAVWGAPEVVVR
ncbi:MAG TPA: hypothetical protein VM364_14440 [Vicinamibacterales bacterium]|nr:hypothetical protein [Vicinamibacterales bacterium]